MVFDNELLVGMPAASARKVHLVLLWPWPLTCWSQNLFSSSLSPTAPKL